MSNEGSKQVPDYLLPLSMGIWVGISMGLWSPTSSQFEWWAGLLLTAGCWATSFHARRTDLDYSRISKAFPLGPRAMLTIGSGAVAILLGFIGSLGLSVGFLNVAAALFCVLWGSSSAVDILRRRLIRFILAGAACFIALLLGELALRLPAVPKRVQPEAQTQSAKPSNG